MRLKSFFGENTSRLYDQRYGRPVEVTDKFHIENVKELLMDERRYTCNE